MGLEATPARLIELQISYPLRERFVLSMTMVRSELGGHRLLPLLETTVVMVLQLVKLWGPQKSFLPEGHLQHLI